MRKHFLFVPKILASTNRERILSGNGLLHVTSGTHHAQLRRPHPRGSVGREPKLEGSKCAFCGVRHDFAAKI